MRNIEEEYQKHELPDDIGKTMEDPYYFVLSVDGLMKKMEREEKITARRRGRNRISQKIFPSERSLLQQEEDCLTQMIELLDDDMDLLTQVIETLTKENFHELVKVVDFLVVHYLENKGYIAGRIEALNQSVSGFGYVDCRFENTHPAVKEFLTKKLESMKKAKQLEKTEKM